ncbi:NAD(P)H-dependent oxidoreductase [Sulfurospirillum barnesii]|uniref:Putative NADPH-quinone reductase (Modulator of drug activity B) n=1 Tax=Sulfurospirillum barnesii (strain ATCC 700032 / DSM 10660 / SES-3) TaxID=760154 RepID=I3Y0B9_SULBS|nr:NAD(P)H-dependent oxidoreductase [Sulfurospirillum barnesii]AFL69643.1 putative NADPH-quinone reductase (modulator of drug activity B) [Sulfurospirillum barnesii SES-3]
MKKTLVILAHPSMNESRLNKALINAISHEEHITVHDLYATYGRTGEIDVKKEQDLLVANERIVFQFPLFWFSTPSLLKEWQDKVLEYGFAYGSEGSKLANKEFKVALTTGSPDYAYQAGAYDHASISELLKPLQITALFTGMVYTAPFAVHGALKIKEEELAQKALEYKALLHEEDWSSSLFKYLQSN